MSASPDKMSDVRLSNCSVRPGHVRNVRLFSPTLQCHLRPTLSDCPPDFIQLVRLSGPTRHLESDTSPRNSRFGVLHHTDPITKNNPDFSTPWIRNNSRLLHPQTKGVLNREGALFHPEGVSHKPHLNFEKTKYPKKRTFSPYVRYHWSL